jgi:hypothetical protein
MVKIQEYVAAQLEELTSIELKDKLGVSLSMISSYKKSYNPSLEVAKRVYKADKVVLHPFAEESLKYELGE